MLLFNSPRPEQRSRVAAGKPRVAKRMLVYAQRAANGSKPAPGARFVSGAIAVSWGPRVEVFEVVEVILVPVFVIHCDVAVGIIRIFEQLNPRLGDGWSAQGRQHDRSALINNVRTASG